MALDMGLSRVLVQFAAREFIGFSWAWLRDALPAYPVSSQHGVTRKKLSLTTQLYAALKFFTCDLSCLET